MEIRENRVHPDHTEHAGTENNDKNILPQRVFIVVLQNGNLLIALIYSWDTFFFVIVCQIFLQIVSDGSRTDIAGVSARSDLFFLSDRFCPQKSATEAPSQKDHFQGSNSFPYCPYLRFQILSLSYHETSFSSILKVNIAKFVFEQITFPSFSSFYLTFPSSSFIIFL